MSKWFVIGMSLRQRILQLEWQENCFFFSFQPFRLSAFQPSTTAGDTRPVWSLKPVRFTFWFRSVLVSFKEVLMCIAKTFLVLLVALFFTLPARSLNQD